MTDEERDLFKQHINTMNAYNALLNKINKIEEENAYITASRRFRYAICEIVIDIIGCSTLINIILAIFFNTSISRIINYIYMSIINLF